jgi:hypothetical protein
MTFLTPFMLFGALAAGIPVAIHFFFRSRYRTVPWAAMKFLLTAVEQTSRRLKFQELLLLLLRMALLVLLALAFARPISSLVRGVGRGDAVDAVFVFDVSYSMGMNDGDEKTRMTRAREEANKIIEELPPHSTVQIIACADNYRVLLGPRSPANLDQAKKIVNDLDITHLATDLYTGVAEAKTVLQSGQSSNKEFYLFSDMQKMGWEKQADILKQSMLDLKEKAVVHLVRCGKETQKIKNATLIDITPQSGNPRPGERAGFAIQVRNTGTEPLENLLVSLAVDDPEDKKLETTTIAKLAKGETRTVTLSGKLGKEGLRVLTAKIKSDDLDADNRLDQVIQVRDKINILVVEGNPNENEKEAEKASTYYLMHALLPVDEAQRAKYRFNPRLVAARQAAPADLKNQDVCILVNTALKPKGGSRMQALPSDFTTALNGFVRDGHGLIIFSGDNTLLGDKRGAEPYNEMLGKTFGILPLPIKHAVKANQQEFPGKDKFFKVDRDSFKNGPASFRVFKDDDHYKLFGEVGVWQYLELDENPQRDIENLTYAYYQQAWSAFPDFNGFTPVDKGFLPKGLFDLGPRKQNNDFGFLFEGTLTVPETGDYSFFLDAAGGARLSINGKAVASFEKGHDDAAAGKPVLLEKGKQSIKLEYYQGDVHPHLSASWSGPGFAFRPLSVTKDDASLSVIARLDNGKPLMVDKTIGAGEVIFIATAANTEGLDKGKGNPMWTDFGTFPVFVPFVNVAIRHLLHGQTQAYNLTAGQTLRWYTTGKATDTFNLIHPGGQVERLKAAEIEGKRLMVTAADLPRAGIYYMNASPSDEPTPIAVVPDRRESEDLQSLGDKTIDENLGFEPIHMTAGDSSETSTGSERLNREWTVWVLLAVLLLALVESLLAWWCGKAW